MIISLTRPWKKVLHTKPPWPDIEIVITVTDSPSRGLPIHKRQDPNTYYDTEVKALSISPGRGLSKTTKDIDVVPHRQIFTAFFYYDFLFIYIK